MRNRSFFSALAGRTFGRSSSVVASRFDRLRPRRLLPRGSSRPGGARVSEALRATSPFILAIFAFIALFNGAFHSAFHCHCDCERVYCVEQTSFDGARPSVEGESHTHDDAVECPICRFVTLCRAFVWLPTAIVLSVATRKILSTSTQVLYGVLCLAHKGRAPPRFSLS